MNADAKTAPLNVTSLLRWQRALRIWNVAVFTAWIVIPFALASSLRWFAGWLHLAVVLLGVLGQTAFVARRNPALKARRHQIGAGTPTWDLAWNMAFWPLMASIASVGGLEQRVRGPSLGWWASGTGVLIVAGGFLLSTWAMISNAFFEGTARIQPDQTVCTKGPYLIVRHPGYAGLALWALGTPLLVRSSWAFIPAAITTLWVLVRTDLEDRLLRHCLPKYQEYARRTRYRLIRGVW